MFRKADSDWSEGSRSLFGENTPFGPFVHRLHSYLQATAQLHTRTSTSPSSFPSPGRLPEFLYHHQWPPPAPLVASARTCSRPRASVRRRLPSSGEGGHRPRPRWTETVQDRARFRLSVSASGPWEGTACCVAVDRDRALRPAKAPRHLTRSRGPSRTGLPRARKRCYW